MLVCSNIDCQAHTLTQLSLWVNNLWLEGGGESKAAGLGGVSNICRLQPLYGGRGGSLTSRPATVRKVGQWHLCVQSPWVGRVGFELLSLKL